MNDAHNASRENVFRGYGQSEPAGFETELGDAARLIGLLREVGQLDSFDVRAVRFNGYPFHKQQRNVNSAASAKVAA